MKTSQLDRRIRAAGFSILRARGAAGVEAFVENAALMNPLVGGERGGARPYYSDLTFPVIAVVSSIN